MTWEEKRIEKMEETMESAAKAVRSLRGTNRIAGALISAADDIHSSTSLRTVVKALANDLISILGVVDDIKEALEEGLEMPEAEKGEEC